MKITINPKTTAVVLTVVVVALVVANLGVQIIRFAFGHEFIFGLYRIFDLNSEGNLPTFYSAVNLLFSAVLLAIIGKDSYARGDRFKLHWAGLSAVFAFLSVDEATELHELIVVVSHWKYDLEGVLFFIWVVPYGILTVILGAVYLRFLVALPKKTRILFISAAFIFLFGAVGMEMVSSMIVSSLGGWDGGYVHLNHVIVYSIEEPLEMIGVVIFIYALLDYLAKSRSGSDITIKFGDD